MIPHAKKKVFSSWVIASFLLGILEVFLAVWLILAADGPKKATLYVWKNGLQNQVFENWEWAKRLRRHFADNGYLLMTQDIHPPKESSLVLYVWRGFETPTASEAEHSYLWLQESPIGVQVPPPPEVAARMHKIFTWDKKLVNNKKYFYEPVPYRLDSMTRPKEKPTTLAVYMGSNLRSNKEANIYPKRRELVHWFMENHPEDFLLYGRGWELYRQRLSPQGRAAFDKRYFGYADDDFHALSQAKFAFIFENAERNDYVSEKIYQAFDAGVVPVYLGAPNIRDYVSQRCFIDFSKFKTFEELYTYLKNMPDEEYQGYLTEIQKWKNSPLNYSNQRKIADSIAFELFYSDPADIQKNVEILYMGRLGNWIFQYAAGKVYAEKHGKTLYTSNSVMQDIFMADDPVMDKDNLSLYHSMPTYAKQKWRVKTSNFDRKPNDLDRPDIVSISGNMQLAELVKEGEKTLRKTLRWRHPPDEDAATQAVVRKIKERNSVSVHVRRGDYVNNSLYFNIPISYYKNAMNYMKEHMDNPAFFVFSNDLQWARENLAFPDTDITFVDVNHGKPDWKDLQLMSLCKHNIIANSTFSWWGAWLNNHPNKIVLTPDHWDYLEWNTIDRILPKEWIRIGVADEDKSIAILYIATGRYIVFWDAFYEAMEKYFAPKNKKHYFIFTDDKTKNFPKNVTRIEQAHMPWPKPTLLRFEMFDRIASRLKHYDYIYFLNGNLLPQTVVTPQEIFPSKEQGLVVVAHPCYYAPKGSNPNTLPYERRPSSTARIPFLSQREAQNTRYWYLAGGFNGGRATDFLTMVQELKQAVETDTANNITAVWHDESHLNRYIRTYQKTRQPLILSPVYLMPEEGIGTEAFANLSDLKDKTKIIVLDKNKKGGHAYLRGLTTAPSNAETTSGDKGP